MKMTAKYLKEITYMPMVTFFSILERPGENRKGGCNNPPVRRGLMQSMEQCQHKESCITSKREIEIK